MLWKNIWIISLTLETFSKTKSCSLSDCKCSFVSSIKIPKYWLTSILSHPQSFLQEQLLILEKELDNADAFNEIFRIAHSVTGLTSVMGYKRMHRLMRKIHEIFFEICNIIRYIEKITINIGWINVLFRVCSLNDCNSFCVSSTKIGQYLFKKSILSCYYTL